MLRSDLYRIGGGEALEADESAGAAAGYAIASSLPAAFPKNDPSVKDPWLIDLSLSCLLAPFLARPWCSKADTQRGKVTYAGLGTLHTDAA